MASPDQQLTFGVLGVAHYHAQHWLAAAVADPRCTTVGVWDDDPSRGQPIADSFEIPFFSELDTLLAQCSAVGIASETRQHTELAIAAAQAGVHLLVEKPMARTTSECDEIIEAVEKAGVVFMQNYPKRYDDAHKELIDAVHSGHIGDLVAVRIRHGNDLKLEGQHDDQGWYADREAAGGGALMDEGIHAADLLLWIAGFPQHVVALATPDPVHDDVDLTATALFGYENGLLGEITSSHAFAAGDASVEVHGTRGVAILSGVDLASRDLSSSPHLKFGMLGSTTFENRAVVPGFVAGKRAYHGRSVTEFVTVVLAGEDPPVGPRDGRRSVAMIEAAYQSIERGTRISLVNNDPLR